MITKVIYPLKTFMTPTFQYTRGRGIQRGVKEGGNKLSCSDQYI